MRILIYSANFAPEPTGIGKYSGEMAVWLAKNGHSVRVVCAPPYYPMWKIEAGYKWPPFARELWHGVDVWRAPLWVPATPRGVTRVLHLLSFAVTSFPVMLRQSFWRPNLVLVVAPAFLCAPTALLVARITGAESWLHLQDFEVDLAFGMGLLKGRLLQRLVLRMERWVFRRFDTVSTISRRMVELLLKKGVAVDRVTYFPNWVDLAHVRPAMVNGRYREELGISRESRVVLFSGSLGGKQGLAVIPEVAQLLQARQDIVFVICGEGVMKQELQQATMNMANVRLLPLQPFERLGELLCMADIHLLPQSRIAADLVLPSKLSGMLASGRPVIATCRIGTELAIVVSECGVVVPPEDSPALAKALCTLVDDTELRLDLGRRARAFAEENFSRDDILRGLFGPCEEDAVHVANDAIA